MPYPKDFFYTLQTILIKQVTAKLEAGDISRRKKVKEKRPSPFLFQEKLVHSGFLLEIADF